MHPHPPNRLRYTRQVNHDVGGNAAIRAPPRRQFSFTLHTCVSCGAMTTRTWFCVDCEDRARPHRDDDPYDVLGGEGEG